MKAANLAQNENFLAIATVEAVKLLAEKSNIGSLSLMKQFVSGKNEDLNKKIAKMVAFAAETTAADL